MTNLTTMTNEASDPSLKDFLPHRSTGLAFAEGAILLGGLALLDFAGVLPFAMWPVHPFLFVVILISAQYGLQGGILAAVGAIALSHLDGWPVRPIDMTYAQYFRMTWADSVSWVLAALTVGIVTSHQGRVLKVQIAKLRKAAMAESLIAAQYQVLAQRTHKLERSLAARVEAASLVESPTAMPVSKATGRGTPRSRIAQNARWNADGSV